MPVIELLHEDERAASGAVVGAVRILDESLITVTTSLVRSGEGVPVDLLPGRYFIDGWSPAGERFHGTIETADSQAVVRVDRPEPRRPETAGSLALWKFNGRSWTRSSWRLGLEADAVVWTPQGGAPKVFVVPPRADLMTDRSEVSLKPGLAATLLGYLHRGDRSSAEVVVREARLLDCGPNLAADVATGYYLVQTGHPDASAWVNRLTWEHPDTADVVVLDAHRMLRSGQSGAAGTFHRAATSGLPFVADGLRLLSAGLEAVGAEPLVRSYVLAQLDTPLTSFWGDDPAAPRREPGPSVAAPSAVAAWKPAQMWRGKGSRQPVDLGFLPRLKEMLQELQHEQHVVWNELGLSTVVVPSGGKQDCFDLDIIAAAWPQALTGIGVGVRDTWAVRLGEFDSRDVCRIRDLRPGPWTFMLCEPPADSHLTVPAVPLPVVQPAMEVLAAAGDVADEVLRATTPNRTTTLVLRRDRDSGFFLEATRPPGRDLVAIGVEYGNNRGSTALRVMPYPVNEWGRRGARIDFDDFDAAGRWQVVEALTAHDLCEVAPDDLVPSLTADLTEEVRDTWRKIAVGLPAPHRDLIDRLVA